MPLKSVTLDASKAFDFVVQESLLRKIFNFGIGGSLWTCIKNLYGGAHSVVKWSVHMSSPFEIRQGVRQGASSRLSTTSSSITICYYSSRGSESDFPLNI